MLNLGKFRYFRKRCCRKLNEFGIDPTKFILEDIHDFGAIIATNLAFIDNVDELPVIASVENAGGIDGNSGNEGYSSGVKEVCFIRLERVPSNKFY